MVRIEMDNGAIIDVELYPDKAPITVKNFVNLAKEGFYDGLTFHRIMAGFMMQGGCPDGTGGGDSGKHIKGEFAKNGFAKRTLHHCLLDNIRIITPLKIIVKI